MQPILASLRQQYHRKIGEKIVRFSSDGQDAFPNFADRCSKSSVLISVRLCEKLSFPRTVGHLDGQKAGRQFEKVTCWFVRKAFTALAHLRPGRWDYLGDQTEISRFVQYRHLFQLEGLLKGSQELASALGLDYLVRPDIVVIRSPVSDAEINQGRLVVKPEDSRTARLTPFRESNQKVSPPAWFLHASISCKWTIRSDRSQNTRTEALNLIRNRKGPLPHIVAVTAEPLPTRIASLALGTGEMDGVYHFALPELEETCRELDLQDQLEMLQTMIQGDRLRDISDLPLDLTI